MRPTAFPLETGVMSPSFSQGILLVHSSIITRRNAFRINKDNERVTGRKARGLQTDRA